MVMVCSKLHKDLGKPALYKTQNKLSVNYKTFCTDFTSINIKQNVNLEYKNKYFYICN